MPTFKPTPLEPVTSNTYHLIPGERISTRQVDMTGSEVEVTIGAPRTTGKEVRAVLFQAVDGDINMRDKATADGGEPFTIIQGTAVAINAQSVDKAKFYFTGAETAKLQILLQRGLAS